MTREADCICPPEHWLALWVPCPVHNPRRERMPRDDTKYSKMFTDLSTALDNNDARGIEKALLTVVHEFILVLDGLRDAIDKIEKRYEMPNTTAPASELEGRDK
jgi:hypothetical protein